MANPYPALWEWLQWVWVRLGLCGLCGFAPTRRTCAVTLQSKVIALMLSVQNYQCLSWLPELLVISKAKELNVITGQRSQGSGCPVFTLVCLNTLYSASSCNSPGRILRIHNSFRVSLIFFGLSSQYETPHVEAVQIWHLEIKLQWFFLWPQPDPQSPTDHTPATSTSTLLPPEATE